MYGCFIKWVQSYVIARALSIVWRNIFRLYFANLSKKHYLCCLNAFKVFSSGEVVGITSGTFADGSQANLNYAWSINVIKPYVTMR